MKTIRTQTREGVRELILCRATECNTITPELRDELAAAIDDADADRDVHVILLRAEGAAFCAGYGLDWSAAAQAAELVEGVDPSRAAEPNRQRVWDSVADMRMMKRFVDTYMKLCQAEVFGPDAFHRRLARLAWTGLATVALLWLLRELRIRPGAALVTTALAMWSPYRSEIWNSPTLSEECSPDKPPIRYRR